MELSKRLKLDIINTRNIIRNKLNALKEGRAEEEVLLEKSYKPVTQSLRQIATSLQNVKREKKDVKLEPKTEEKEEAEASFLDTHPASSSSMFLPPNFLESEVIAEHEPDEPSVEEENISSIDKTIQEMIEHPSFREYLDQYDPLPRQYIEEMLTNSDEFDYNYGVHHDVSTEKFKIGDKELTIDGKDLIINNIRYAGTPGLYELVFKKHPIGHKPNDVNQYTDILKRTNAHRRNYLATGQIQGNKSWKYKNIIAPQTLEKRGRIHSWAGSETKFKKVGKGLHMNLSNKNTNYVYWDNPNELVDRLRLLLASKDVGNTGHNNEIVSIIEELNEANILVKC